MTATATRRPGPGPVADLSVGPPAPPEVGDVPDAGLELAESVPQVDESMVRALVQGLGGALGYAAGDPDVPNHWRFTDQELGDLVPPLTRIVNRHAHLRRAVIRGDEMALGLVLAGYAGRNLALARTAREARRELEGETDGAAVDLGAGSDGVGGDGAGHGDGGGFPGPPARGLR